MGDCGSQINKILHRLPKRHLSHHSSTAAIAITFRSYFLHKISVISSSFPSDAYSRALNSTDTYWLAERLYRCISYTYSVCSQLIALQGMFPDTFQVCNSLSFVEKPTLNRDDMKHSRPMSNLSFLSKILEKVVASRLNSHINSSHTSNDYQSTYRKLHSTETALL